MLTLPQSGRVIALPPGGIITTLQHRGWVLIPKKRKIWQKLKKNRKTDGPKAVNFHP
jgi:hypothetical protein